MEPESTAGVGHQTRRGISWNLAGALATNGMRVVVLAVLGRALTSHDFGVVAAAVSVNAIVYAIRDIGIGPALIQRKQLDDGHLETAFAVSMYVGVFLAAVLFACAPLIARVFHITESVEVIYALAVLFVLRNVAITSRMICRRAMNFRLIAILEASSFSIGSITAIACAVTMGGPWSLVIGYWVEELIGTALYLHYSPPKWSLRVDRAKFRDLLGFGAGQSVTQVTNVVALYGDNVVVGRSLGPDALGFYSRAFDLVKFPALIFTTIVGSVLFSAFSRIQDDRPRLAANFRRISFVNALALLPASAALIVLAPETIRIVIGPSWGAAVVPFQILAITMMMRTSQRLAGVVATSAGRVNGVALSTIVYVIVLVGGAAVSVRWGIAAVAATTSIAAGVLWLECCYLAMDLSGTTLSQIVRAHVPGVMLAALVLALGWPLARELRSLGSPAVATFAIVATLSITSCGLLVWFWVRRGHGDFRWLGQELRRITRRRKAHDGSR